MHDPSQPWRPASRLIHAQGVAIDAVTVAYGLIVLLIEIPPTVSQLYYAGPGTKIWAAGLTLAGLVTLVGTLLWRTVWEVAGCYVSIACLLTWSVAAVARPDASAISWAVALVLAQTALLQHQRSVIVAAGLIPHRAARRSW